MARLRVCVLAAVAACSVTPVLAQTSPAGVYLGVLSPQDVQRYRQIFQDEASGNFADAQTQVVQLTDRSLVGYAQAEHYLSSHSGQATVDELVSWLNQYADLPIADQIYKLAIQRASREVWRHHRVVAVKLTATIPTPAAAPRQRGGGYEDPDSPDRTISSPAGRAALTQVNAAIRAGQPAQADATVQTLASSGTAPGSDVARLYQRVAAAYLTGGQDYQAFDAALRPAGSDRLSAPMLDWWAGLAAYRMGRYDIAASRFETLAQNATIPTWTKGAAAFWAARAYMQWGAPRHVVTLLNVAASQEPTFYGMLAEKLLGRQNAVTFSDPVADPASFNALMQDPAAHRAVALWQTGQSEYLHVEMTRALANLDLRYGQAYAALAKGMNLANLELRDSEMLAAHGVYLKGLFPVPGYSPAGGYRLDRALVLAVTRTESKFQPNATSPAGARGLMQLMPATAAEVAGGKPSESQLCDPSYNLSLGQKYLERLLALTGGGVLQLAAAYNAGPGNVERWMAGKSDPLMFIETMPAQQTRAYVKRVMTYYWMYSRLAGERAQSLDETARGYWPRYAVSYSSPAASVPARSAAPSTAAAQQRQRERQKPAKTLLISDASVPH